MSILLKSIPKDDTSKICRYTEDLSMHGIQNWSATGRNPGVRTSWLFIFLCCLAYSGVLCRNHVLHYLAYDIKQQTTLEDMVKDSNDSVPFPAITVCTPNAWLKSKIGKSEKFLKLMTQKFFLSRRGISLNNTELNELVQDCKVELQPGEEKNNLTKQLDMGLEYFIQQSSEYPEHGFRRMSYISDDHTRNLVRCRWLGAEYDCKNMFISHVTDSGICFTFNANFFEDSVMWYEAQPIREVRDSGMKNGLEIVLRTDEEEYCVSSTTDLAYQITIHNPQTHPSALLRQRSSFIVGPGFSYQVPIVKHKFKMTTAKLGRCVPESTKLKMYPNIEYYDQESCYHECITNLVFESCHCFPHYAPASVFTNLQEIYPELEATSGSDLFCVSGADQVECFTKTMNGATSNGNQKNICPHCKRGCRVETYESTISSAYYPSRYDFNKFTEANTTTLEDFRSQYLQINFYMQSLSASVTTENQLIGVEELLANIGGAVGLFLGASIISFIEILQFLIIIIYTSLCKLLNCS